MPSRRRNTGLESSEYEHDDPTLDDLRGQTPDELRAIVADLDVTLGELHLDGQGTPRDLGDDDGARFDRLMRVRSQAEARLRQHAVIAETYARHPGAVTRAYGNLETTAGAPGQSPGRGS